MKPFQKYRVLKITGIIVLLLVAIVFGVSKYLSHHYKVLLQAKLPEIAAKASDSLYHITVGGFQVNVIGRSISVFNLHVWADSNMVAKKRSERKLPAMLMDISVPEIEVKGLKLGNFATEKEIVCRTADIYHPKIFITFTDTASRDHTVNPPAKSNLERVFAKALNIHDPQLNIVLGEDKNAAVIKAKGGRLLLNNWEFHPGIKPDTTRFFYAEEADIKLCNIGYRRPELLYAFGLDTLKLMSAAHTATLHGAYVKPTVSKPAFYREVKTRKEIYQGTFKTIDIAGFQWEALLQNRGFAAASLSFTNPNLEIYLSRLYPANMSSKVGNYPHELLVKMDFPVQVPVVNLYHGNFSYTEVNEKTQRPGILEFSSIIGKITDLSNRPEQIRNQEHCRVFFTAKFMRKSSMGAIFDFPLDAPHGDFSVKGRLLELDGSQVSETAKALALAEIKSLKVHQLDFDICGNDHSADGRITILYNDLKVKIKKVDEETLQLRNRGFISFVANELLLYNDNPMEGEPIRRASTHVIRDSTKSFFNLIWRNLFEAGIQTAVRQEGITDMVKKRQANKGKQKLHFFRQLFPKRAKKLKQL